MADNKYNIPVLIMRGLILMPNNEVKLEVGRDFSKKAIDTARSEFDGKIFVTTQKDPFVDEFDTENTYLAGVIAYISSKITLPNGNYRVSLKGITRAKIEKMNANTSSLGYIEADVLEHPTVVRSENEEIALMRKLMNYVDVYVNKLSISSEEMLQRISGSETADVVVDVIAFNLPSSIAELQEYNELEDVNDRILKLINDLEREKELSKLEKEINEKVKKGMEDSQKEYYLREKMRAIREELGDTGSKDVDAEELKDVIENLGLPPKVLEKAMAELQRYESMPGNSQEASIIRTYLDWIISIPWSEESKDESNILKVEKSLDQSHFGLEKVKERILDYIAVKERTHSLKSPIICLIGPPGTGKTSLAKGIAEALNRNFVKVSLGGVRDESEIRGHRRTYLGSMPGRIIQGMKNAKTTNPVFLLDEIDKMSSDFRGDPSSAMLEVLDPEQNSRFSDHYLEEEYDLSNVMFIATANYVGQIPRPLLDRMEIIDLSGYTEIEKQNIAKLHLLPRQLENHGLKSSDLSISKPALLYIIRHYTQEAGVRQLEREIAKICRKTVRNISKLEANNKKIVKTTITNKNIEEYLGKLKFKYSKKAEKDTVGVVTGLAYTAFGGDILPIEANYFKGSGKVILTGQLGDVMKESARIALSYIQSNSKLFNVNTELIKESDIHIHVPEGAVPKDGPSAGITLTTAIISSLTNRKVNRNIGMTGEITLHGKVLPIGGLREKTISAHRSGIRTIIVPKENERDLVDIPSEVKDEMNIILVDKYQDVYKEILV
ncbi:MAG: endopeptidase La [Bacilli bacterium]